MDENTSNSSTSPYMFRPILEPSNSTNDDSVSRSYHSHHSTAHQSTPYHNDRLSVMERNCSTRIRVPSGGTTNTIELPSVNIRKQKKNASIIGNPPHRRGGKAIQWYAYLCVCVCMDPHGSGIEDRLVTHGFGIKDRPKNLGFW